MTDRDPRIDSQPGDVLIGNSRTRRVLGRDDLSVRCYNPHGEEVRFLLEDWRVWCELTHATVDKLAERTEALRRRGSRKGIYERPR